MKRGTFWVCFIDKNCFGSYGSAVLKNFLEYLKTKHENVFILIIYFKKTLLINIVRTMFILRLYNHGF